LTVAPLDNAAKIAELQQSACFACKSQLSRLSQADLLKPFFYALLAAEIKKER
jgi:hypothetical protein